MFNDETLANHLKNNHTIKLRSIVLSEWNMNQADNIKYIGTYKYRPQLLDVLNLQLLNSSAVSSTGKGKVSEYSYLIPFFDEHDTANAYKDAYKSYLYEEIGYVNNELVTLLQDNERMSQLYDIKACVEPFRPRSGINKAMMNLAKPQFTDRFRSAERPRFYASSKQDQFKYWTSFKTEGKETYGVSTAIDAGFGYQIHDAVPFVVYNEEIPVNRITIKMQTHVGSFNIGNNDPLYGQNNATIPKKWRVEYLTTDDIWKTAISFDSSSLRLDGSPIIDWDGHVEIKYGIKVPEKYQDNFWFVDYLTSQDMLPPTSNAYIGEAYAIVNDSSAGTIYICGETGWDTYPIEYDFSVLENTDYGYGIRSCVTNLVDPPFYMEDTKKQYREFLYIKGIRVVVETMNTPNSMFELIEISPRLVTDLTKYVTDFSFTKSIHNSDTDLPVGGIIASNGSISLSNDDLAFSSINKSSIISKYLRPNVKFIFFEGIRNVGIYEKLIPIKWLYAESFSNVVHQQTNVSVELRDLTFLLENKKSPEIYLRNIPLTAAVMILLDSIGFSNYRFIGFENYDPIIPNFFIGTGQNVAEVLKNISIATQTAMFFDEYNNFTIYSKDFIFDSDREIDLNINVNREVTYADGEWVDNDGENIGIANVETIEPETLPIINDGTINFTTRYIQRSVTKVKQATLTDEEREYGYKPVLLWEVAPTDSDKSINAPVQQQQGFVLGAIVLNSDVDDKDPYVENNEIVNNVIDVGANIFWVPRHRGYLYANTEIIKYDAIEYIVSGQSSPVWISDNAEYQFYFGNLPFNGKMFPTGNIRIFSEPYYESINGVTKPKNGEVRISGRGQFGTKKTYHIAGINPEWLSGLSLYGISVNSIDIFSSSLPTTATAISSVTLVSSFIPSGSTSTKTVSSVSAFTITYDRVPKYVYKPYSGGVTTNDIAARSKRSDIIKNFMSTKSFDEGAYIDISDGRATRRRSKYRSPALDSAALKASALVFTGPQQFNGTDARDFISYISKNLEDKYIFFGTRMRIIGEINSDDTHIQSPLGSMQMFNIVPESTDKPVVVSGGSGGLGIMLDGESGYFLEIMSLTEDNSRNYIDFINEGADYSQLLQNVVLWKKTPTNLKAEKLWGGTTSILIDSGTFVGQDRAIKDVTPTVYDIGIEYSDENNIRKFKIFINNKQVASNIEDKNPLKITPLFGPFVRGSSKCMFENIYAIGVNRSYTDEYSSIYDYVRPDLNPEAPSEVFRKYTMNSFVTDSYLTSLNSSTVPKYKLFYDEFGTTMRECFYFNIKYDQAYPALYAKIAPTFNKERSYSVAGFVPTPYGAEFLIFNNADKPIVLDETTGSFLRISGITFTQNTTYEYTVDEYFKKISNFNEKIDIDYNLYAENPNKVQLQYKDIKNSRNTYGVNGFNLTSDYIQTWQQADDLMGWIIKTRIKPKDQYSLKLFAVPHLQLGDIVNIYYDQLIDASKKFIVTDIAYSRQPNGIETTIKIMEI